MTLWGWMKGFVILGEFNKILSIPVCTWFTSNIDRFDFAFMLNNQCKVDSYA